MKNYFINQSTVIGISTAYFYLLWFQYERGICNYYEIPDYYIEPSISGLLLCAIGFFTVLGISFKAISALTPILQTLQDDSKRAWHGIIFINIFYLILGIILSSAKKATLKEVWHYFLPILVFNIIFLLVFWLYRKKGRTTEAQIKLSVETLNQTINQGDIFSLFKIKLTPNQIYLIVILFILPFFMFFLGERKANATNEFWVICGSKKPMEMPIIVKKFGDYLFCREADSTFNFKYSLKIINSKTENLKTQYIKLDIVMKK